MRRVEAISPSRIGNLTFSIPIYQRLFEWEEPQLNGLLSDIKAHIDKSKNNSPYYIGMLTGHIQSEGGRIELVDGQQRFTTLMLFGICMRKLYAPWANFITHTRLKITARIKDQLYLENLVDSNDFELINSDEVNLKMRNALTIITDFLNAIEKNESKAAQVNFCKEAYERICFFVSILPSSYNAPNMLNKYFESMNSAGRSLEQHEKVKVDLLKRCDSDHKDILNAVWNAVERMDTLVIADDTTALDRAIDIACDDELRFDIVANEIVSTNGNEELGEHIEMIIASADEPKTQYISKKQVGSVVNFQQLLLLALNITLDKCERLDKYKLEERFRMLPAQKIEAFYRNLLKTRLLLDKYVIRIEHESNRNVYCPCLSVEDANEADNRLKQYQSMLYVSTEAHLWLQEYIVTLMQKEFRDTMSHETASNLLAWLKTHDNSRHHTEIDLIKKLDTENPNLLDDVSFLSYDHRVDRYWFWRLDYYLWENRQKYFTDKQCRVVEKYVFRENRSIEHLHPQNQSQNLSDEWTDVRDIHSYGNLALISSSFNSEQSNDPLRVKFARIENQENEKSLESLKMYKMYLDSLDNHNNWTIETKNQHMKEMLDLLKSTISIGDIQ